MPLSYKDVAEILRIIDASRCEEVVLDVDGLRLVARRGAAGGGAAATLPPAAEAQAPSQATSPAPGAVRSRTTAPAGQGLLQVRAPTIGTFHRRPSPGAEPFVEVGRQVAKGDPLCLIAVMKLFTTISAPEAGTVERIAADDGDLVEFDQVLCVIRRAGA